MKIRPRNVVIALYRVQSWDLNCNISLLLRHQILMSNKYWVTDAKSDWRIGTVDRN